MLTVQAPCKVIFEVMPSPKCDQFEWVFRK